MLQNPFLSDGSLYSNIHTHVNENIIYFTFETKQIRYESVLSCKFKIILTKMTNIQNANKSGCTGLIGHFLRYVSPLTIAPTVSLVGLTLFKNAANAASQHWGIASG